MTELALVVELKGTDISDVALTLRNLAQHIEDGDYGEIINLAWVMRNAEHEITPGYIGKSGSPQGDGYLLLSRGLRELEKITIPTR